MIDKQETAVVKVSRDQGQIVHRIEGALLPQGIIEVRIVQIDGLDLQADGGTHVANTQEVGPIRIADYKSKGKINKRIQLEIGP